MIIYTITLMSSPPYQCTVHYILGEDGETNESEEGRLICFRGSEHLWDGADCERRRVGYPVHPLGPGIGQSAQLRPIMARGRGVDHAIYLGRRIHMRVLSVPHHLQREQHSLRRLRRGGESTRAEPHRENHERLVSTMWLPHNNKIGRPEIHPGGLLLCLNTISWSLLTACPS